MTPAARHRPIVDMPQARPLSDAERVLVLRLCREGLNPRQIARRLGRPHGGMWSAVIHNLKAAVRRAAARKDSTKGRPGETEAELVARHAAERGITACPTAWAPGSVIMYSLDMRL